MCDVVFSADGLSAERKEQWFKMRWETEQKAKRDKLEYEAWKQRNGLTPAPETGDGTFLSRERKTDTRDRNVPSPENVPTPEDEMRDKLITAGLAGRCLTEMVMAESFLQVLINGEFMPNDVRLAAKKFCDFLHTSERVYIQSTHDVLGIEIYKLEEDTEEENSGDETFLSREVKTDTRDKNVPSPRNVPTPGEIPAGVTPDTDE